MTITVYLPKKLKPLFEAVPGKNNSKKFQKLLLYWNKKEVEKNDQHHQQM